MLLRGSIRITLNCLKDSSTERVPGKLLKPISSNRNADESSQIPVLMSSSHVLGQMLDISWSCAATATPGGERWDYTRKRARRDELFLAHVFMQNQSLTHDKLCWL